MDASNGTTAETTDNTTTAAAAPEPDSGFITKLRAEVTYFETFPVEFLKKIEAVAKSHFA